MSALNEEEEFEFLYQMEKEAKAGIPPPNPAPVKASDMDKMIGSVPGRFALGLASPLIGAAQLGANVGTAISEQLPGHVEGGPMSGQWVNQKLAELEASKQRGMKAAGTEGMDWMGLAGSILPGAAVAKGATALLPAAKTAGQRIMQGGGIGAITSAVQPVLSPEFWTEKGKQLLWGTGVGATIPAVGEVIRPGTSQLNPVQAATLKEGQAAGYVVPPSTVNPSFVTNRLESIAGKTSVGQEAAKRNQAVTNALAAKALGLPKGTTLTPQVLTDFRAEQGKVYEQVAGLSDKAKSALGELKQARHDAKVQWNYYNRSGNPEALTTAKNADAMAEMATDELTDAAKQAGRSDLIQALTEARVKIAKSFDVSRMLNPASGEVSGTAAGKLFAKKGEKAMTGELATIGKMAGAFRPSMREAGTVPSPGVSGTDAAASALLATIGGGMAGPAGIVAGGLPLLRGPARNLVLSPGYQQFATQGLSPQRQAIIDALMRYGAASAGTTAGRAIGQP